MSAASRQQNLAGQSPAMPSETPQPLGPGPDYPAPPGPDIPPPPGPDGPAPGPGPDIPPLSPPGPREMPPPIRVRGSAYFLSRTNETFASTRKALILSFSTVAWNSLM